MTLLKPLTTRQFEVLEFVKAYLAAEGFPPTLREICDAFGFASPNSAHDHLRALEKKGAIELHTHISRGIKVIEGGRYDDAT